MGTFQNLTQKSFKTVQEWTKKISIKPVKQA